MDKPLEAFVREAEEWLASTDSIYANKAWDVRKPLISSAVTRVVLGLVPNLSVWGDANPEVLVDFAAAIYTIGYRDGMKHNDIKALERMTE